MYTHHSQVQAVMVGGGGGVKEKIEFWYKGDKQFV